MVLQRSWKPPGASLWGFESLALRKKINRTRGCYPLFVFFAISFLGEVLEWLKRLPWKGSIPARVSWVRIPPSPQNNFYVVYFTYILKGLKDSKYYYGSTGNIASKLIQHNTGKVKSTKYRRPLILHYSEEFQSKQEAASRERFYK